QLRPRVAAVRSLVDSDASLAPRRAAVPFARADVECVPTRVVWICDESANGVESQDTGEPCPTRARSKRIVRAPDAAACSANPEPAVPWHARRTDDQRRVTTRCRCRGPRERQHTGLDGVLNRAVRLPVVVASLSTAGVRGRLRRDLVERLLGVLHHRHRNHVGWIGPRRGFVCFITAYRSFAWYSTGVCQQFVLTGDLECSHPIL